MTLRAGGLDIRQVSALKFGKKDKKTKKEPMKKGRSTERKGEQKRTQKKWFRAALHVTEVQKKTTKH